MFRIVTLNGSTKAVLMNLSPDRESVIPIPLGSEIRLFAYGNVLNLMVTEVCKIARAEARLVECVGNLPASDFVGNLEKSKVSDKVFVMQALDRKRPREQDADHDGQLGQSPRNKTA